MEIRDFIIIGGGPAGLSAALVAASNQLPCLILEQSSALGGQIRLADAPVLDVLGRRAKNGKKLIKRFCRQIHKRDSIKTRCLSEIVRIRRETACLRLELADGREYSARAVLLATGTRLRQLNIPGEDNLDTFDSARSAMHEYAGQSVVVVGGGDEAADLARCLAEKGAAVTMVLRAHLRARPRFAEPLRSQTGVKLIENVQLSKIEGQAGQRILTLDNRKIIEATEVFIRIGVEPVIPHIEPAIKQASDGRISVDAHGRTSVAGLYAAGDLCRLPEHRYVSVAIADGVIAARTIESQLAAKDDQ